MAVTVGALRFEGARYAKCTGRRGSDIIFSGPNLLVRAAKAPVAMFEDELPDGRGLRVFRLSEPAVEFAEPITLTYAKGIAYLTAAFLRQADTFALHPVLERTPWFL